MKKEDHYFVIMKPIVEGESFIDFNLSFVQSIGVVHFTFQLNELDLIPSIQNNFKELKSKGDLAIHVFPENFR